ncbi:SPFH domain / band 7 family domain-containing protein [Trichoderma breve]|uniref:SPFH domain / band 7 family domain-containing protein n=1 Tax=Trichoderma breve TaxID=2034170 RepID=A0A9W9BAS8_9HYPO|nr:SPFH domain / band 7 family domain-containing protein [Trichoderma breve]KAJ4857889.1 SPFH domain / band 7 family domain-containing protein [Trichoderma breve]
MASYKISAPDEYLAITGMGIRTPHDYAMDLQAMTKEKLQFSLPVVFTVGPDVNQHALVKYAMLLARSNSGNRVVAERDHVENIVKGIIEGETRVLVSGMTMEEIFTEREVFKRRIFRNIQGELQQFGLKIYNSNVKELKDAPNSIYFESLSKKAHEGATNQARIDVAEAQLRGNVGEAKKKGEQDREIAKINAETAVQKTERDIERAEAEARLHTQQAALTRDVEIARVTAKRTLESTDENLKREVEVKRAAAEMERLRAQDVVKATIIRESKQQAADALAYELNAKAKADWEAGQRAADTDAYKTRVSAEANQEASQRGADTEVYKSQKASEANAYKTRAADAEAYRVRVTAEANQEASVRSAEAALVKTLKEAEGITAMADAYGKLSVAFGGPAGLLQYMMIKDGTLVELAKANASAIRGLEPKISVWNTGNQGSGSESTDVMRNVYQMLPPLMTTINEQTGITLPEWQFGRLNAAQGAMTESNVNGAGKKK